MKRIQINEFEHNNNWRPIPLTYKDAHNIGLQYVFGTHGAIYDVIDEQLFMLAVIQHGLKFVEVVEKSCRQAETSV